MAYDVVRSRLEYDGAIVKVRVDTVVQPDGSRTEREVLEHVGSVAVVAVDDQQRVLLIRQYRHPAGKYLWELPAGLCDKPGEPPLGTWTPSSRRAAGRMRKASSGRCSQ
jgi:8-oxo-dGDP phosphatase